MRGQIILKTERSSLPQLCIRLSIRAVMFMSARAGKSAPLDLCHVMNTIAHCKRHLLACWLRYFPESAREGYNWSSILSVLLFTLANTLSA